MVHPALNNDSHIDKDWSQQDCVPEIKEVAFELHVIEFEQEYNNLINRQK